jgi:hypothetical protein
MQDEFNENVTLRAFQERNAAELRSAIADVKWWKDKVTRRVVKWEDAKGYIEAAKRVINLKRHVLGFPEFPC